MRTRQLNSTQLDPTKLKLNATQRDITAKVQSVNFPDLPIRSAAWTRGGREIVLTGRRPFYYTYDVVAGKVCCVA